MKIEIKAAQVASKWVAFKANADLSDIPAEKLAVWVMDSVSCDTGTLIKVGSKIDVPATSAAYPLAYNIAFAQVHLHSVEGPLPSEGKPSREYLETTLPVAVLTAYVNRADTSRPLTEDEFASLRAPLETGSTPKTTPT